MVGGVELPVQRILYILNPMASLINVYRNLLYNGYRTDIDFFIRTALTALLALGFGYWFFTRYSDRFGEEV
jgi:ABC-type polysaccharide/polyol phosphate export permease